mgnify:CR=1 FL=1
MCTTGRPLSHISDSTRCALQEAKITRSKKRRVAALLGEDIPQDSKTVRKEVLLGWPSSAARTSARIKEELREEKETRQCSSLGCHKLHKVKNPPTGKRGPVCGDCAALI